MNTAAHRASEGWRSARNILDDTQRPQMPQPLLLTPVTGPGAAYQPAKVAPLRSIKPARAPREATMCGFGTCALDPACTGRCRYRQADEALRGHYSDRHNQRQAMPNPQGQRQAADISDHVRRLNRQAKALAFWLGVSLAAAGALYLLVVFGSR